ncbi:MAG: PH domain-containing protein [Patescibacteria group bacterium]
MALVTTALDPPHPVLFPGQQAHEEILIFVRRHWMPFVLWAVFIGIMLLIPLVTGFIVVVLNGSQWFLDGKLLPYVGLGLGAYLLLVNAIFFTVWIEQYLDVAIITSDRLVNIRQLGLFNRRVAELGMDRVQDVSAHMNGYLQSIFQFGTVVVETAGGAPDFVIRNVAKPHIVANTILMIHDQNRKAQFVRKDKDDAVPIVVQESLQQTLVENVPSVAPPADYKREQLQEDLFMQAIEARDEASDILDTADSEVLVATKEISQATPNRLPPRRSMSTEIEGQLTEGEVISIDE